MANFRLQSLQIYNEMEVPDWGPSIEGLNMEDIVTYVKPNTHMSAKWSEVPEDIKDTFEKLGIPQAERKSLAGVGAQYDSELVYHNVREEVAAQGVVYTDMESALNGEYADMVRKHFMKLVTPRDHKFAALHGAVWSGGSFVYVPPGVSVTIPLQSYFRLNAPGAGQFEHTLIIVDEGAYLHFIEGCSAPKYNVANLHAGCVELYVKKGAKLRYSTIENWSKNMYNLNTKRALVEEDGLFQNYIDDTARQLYGLLNFPLPPLRPLEENNGKEVFQLIAFFRDGEEEQQIMAALPHCEATRWNPLFADVVPQGSSKAIGIDKIIAHYGIRLEETMAFGDGGNDIPMLRHAGIGVAMGNSTTEVQAAADWVTTSVDEDGIMNALRHFGVI